MIYEQSTLWGKDLFSYLADLYSNKAKYVIVFVSKYYKEKRWTIYEFRFINERVFKSKEEYLLPVMLDNTEIEEIPLTYGYLQNKTPYEVAVLLAKKLNNKIDVEFMKRELEGYLPNYKITILGESVHFYSETEDFEQCYPLSLLMELYKNDLLFELFVSHSIVLN